MIDADTLRAAGTSKSAIGRHYDLSDEFFQTWLASPLLHA
jgi:cyclopropane fatty-acyl-phospholipid synthase-like methyltransferase